MNWSCRYCSTQAVRRILPLVVVGIDPGDTRTRSLTFTPCALDIAEVTSLLTPLSQCIASTVEFPRFLTSMTVTSFSVLFTGTEIAATRQERDDKFKQVVTLEDQLAQAKGEWERFRKRNEELAADIVVAGIEQRVADLVRE